MAKSGRRKRDEDPQVEALTEALSHRVQSTLEQRGLPRRELARRLGVSPAYVTQLLGGRANFTLDTLVKLSRALGLELRCALVESPAGRASAKSPTAPSSPRAAGEGAAAVSGGGGDGDWRVW